MRITWAMFFEASYTMLTIASCVSAGELYLSGSVFAQTSPITPSGLNTQIAPSTITPGEIMQYDITGGTRAGTNLFHSFGEFNVPTNHIANFLNDSGLETTYILGRVTGGNPSDIFGAVQTTGFRNANLFLMNPAGIVFGPNASLSVGGSVAFTTADYLRLSDGIQFNAVPNTAADALLSTAPVTAYGFLDSNIGAIIVRGSKLTVNNESGVSLVGGAITVQSSNVEHGTTRSAHISAPEGQVNLASAASRGEISAVSFMPMPGMTMGNISLSQGALLDVSANATGTVRIRGGHFTIDNATISADTINTAGASTAIDINLTGDFSITDTRGTPAITARATGSGDAGEVKITSANLVANSTAAVTEPFALVDSHTAGIGNAGSISIQVGDLEVSHPSTNNFVFIDSGSSGPGHGGNVTITAKNITSTNATMVSSGDFVATNTLENLNGVVGSAGDLTIKADTLNFKNTIINTNSTSAGDDTQQAGNLSITASSINIVNGQIEAIGNARGGFIKIDAGRMIVENTFFQTETAGSTGGGIEVKAKAVELTNGSTLVSNTFGDATAGDIRINASDYLKIVGRTTSSVTGTFRPSGIFSNSFEDGAHNGNAGSITVESPRVEMVGGRINTSTETGGQGGNVTIKANAISISGEFANPDTPEPIYNITNIHPSGIFTKSVGSKFCPTTCGRAGNISISTGSLSMSNGAQIDSGTSGTGHGGIIDIRSTNTINLSGTLTDGSPVGIFSRTIGQAPNSGAGGDISLRAGQSVSIQDGASVSAGSTGPGNAGNIEIRAGQQLNVRDSPNAITTEAAKASGGDINIRAIDRIYLVNSQISASVSDGPGGGGNVTIDPQFVVLQNSKILAQAERRGGDISIITGVFQQDATSKVNADAERGVNGTVRIEAPYAPAGGKIQPLGNRPLQAASLLNQRCASVAGGQFSSFTVAGRNSLPTEPGGWLSSPLAPSISVPHGATPHGDTMTSKGLWASHEPTEEFPSLSLRQIAPSRLLTNAFTINRFAGCRS